MVDGWLLLPFGVAVLALSFCFAARVGAVVAAGGAGGRPGVETGQGCAQLLADVPDEGLGDAAAAGAVGVAEAGEGAAVGVLEVEGVDGTAPRGGGAQVLPEHEFGEARCFGVEDDLEVAVPARVFLLLFFVHGGHVGFLFVVVGGGGGARHTPAHASIALLPFPLRRHPVLVVPAVITLHVLLARLRPIRHHRRIRVLRPPPARLVRPIGNRLVLRIARVSHAERLASLGGRRRHLELGRAGPHEVLAAALEQLVDVQLPVAEGLDHELAAGAGLDQEKPLGVQLLLVAPLVAAAGVVVGEVDADVVVRGGHGAARRIVFGFFSCFRWILIVFSYCSLCFRC